MSAWNTGNTADGAGSAEAPVSRDDYSTNIFQSSVCARAYRTGAAASVECGRRKPGLRSRQSDSRTAAPVL